MSPQANASPEQIEREIASTRAEISDTLDAIQTRFSPTRLLAETFGVARGAAAGAARGARYAGGGLRETGEDFVGNLGRTIRENPLPFALFGIGLGWLMLAGRRHNGGAYEYGAVGYEAGPARQYDEPHPPPYGYAAPTAANPDYAEDATYEHEREPGDEHGQDEQPGAVGRMTEGARERAGRAYKVVEGSAGRVSDTMAEIGAGVRARAAGAAQGAGETASRVRQRVGEAAEAARGYAGRAGSSARGYADRAAHTAHSLSDRAGALAERARLRATHVGRDAYRIAEEHPLLTAAGLFAAGALIAAMLPRTRREDELMGEGAEAMRQTARGAIQEAKETAAAVAGAARDAAEREGLRPSDLQQKAGRVAQAAGDAARSEAQSIAPPGGHGDSGAEEERTRRQQEELRP